MAIRAAGTVFFLMMAALVPVASAGVTITSGEVIINAGETRTFCDFFVFATQDGGVYHVQTSGEIREFTEKIEPNDFELRAIDCPEEREARISCKNYLCESGATEMCRQICIDFKAPLLFSFDPQFVKYQGAISNTAQIGLASLSEPMSFQVVVVPIDLKPIAAVAAVAVIGVVLGAVRIRRRRKRRHLPSV